MDVVVKRVMLVIAIAVVTVILWNVFEDKFYDAVYDKTDVYAEVIDKRTYTVVASSVLITKYEVTVKIDNSEHKINIPGDAYSKIDRGDKIEVTVYTSKDEIVDVKYKSSIGG